ncbi:hypothetical protein FJZ40_00750 [Candidatus Shapirobacteria bacterium]|nr:hypothetical protein [Candidatus Shapirobacteria bacterium]
MKDGIFNSALNGRVDLDHLILEIVSFVSQDRQAFYKLVVGSDSQGKRENGLKVLDIVTAVVIHRMGKGGRYFWRRIRKEKISTIRDKIYTETILSLEAAQELVPRLKVALVGLAPYDLEIHIDVGEVGPTREMIKEVVGMVTGNGFVAKTKPEGYGAYVVADKHT